MSSLAYILFCVAWALGIASAEGFWQSLAAYLFPPYAWVLLAEGVLARWPL